MANNGLTPTGFVPLSLSEIETDLQQALQQAFGGSAVDLSSQSFWGQLIGIIANANSDLWQGLAGLYASSYPAGASGVALDNILAIAGTSRLPARATVTNPSPATGSNGQTLYGLVLRGTPNTVVPAGTLLSNGASSPATFSLDANVTIAAANNATQVVYFTNVATSGSYTLTFTSPAGDVLTTPAIQYNTPLLATALSYTSFNPRIFKQFQIVIDGSNTSNTISYGGTATFGNRTYIVAGLDAQSFQSAINAIAGYESVTVTGDPSTQLQVLWNQAPPGTITFTGNGYPDVVTPSVSNMVSALANAAGQRPFTDVVLQNEAQNILVQFGTNKPVAGQPNTNSVFVPLVQVGNLSLARGSAQTLTNVAHRQLGSPAQGIGNATCTSTGATVVLANQLTNIVNPVSGLTSVNNDLDCLTGRDIESDAEAVARLQSSQGVASSGSLASILARLRAITGVSQAVGFQNTTNAAQQVLEFASAPTQGQFTLYLGGQTTQALAYNAQAADVQAAIQSLQGFSQATVRAYGQLGFLIDFGGDSGKQAQALCRVPSNTTGVVLSAYFGRGAHAVELVVQGGADADIASAILDTLPAGIATYSDPALRTIASLTANGNLIAPTTVDGVAVGQQVLAAGLPLGTLVTDVNNGVVTLSKAALTTASNVPISFAYGSLQTDSEGNYVDIAFSRPISTLIYLEVDLVTDLFNTPGQPGSGYNASAKFSQANVGSIQNDLISLVNSVPIGGTLVANGSNSLGGSFRDVPGVLNYTLKFDRVSPPQNQANLQLNDNEAPLAESYSIAVNVS